MPNFDDSYGGCRKWWYPFRSLEGFLFGEIPSKKMEDDWGYPHDETETPNKLMFGASFGCEPSSEWKNMMSSCAAEGMKELMEWPLLQVGSEVMGHFEKWGS